MEKSVTQIALFAALIAILGLIPKIDLVSGVPITMQSLGIMLCGTVLGARRGALAAGLFLALVAAGAPLLSGGRGGLGVFLGPSVGYLLGFPLAAFAAGWIVQRWQSAHLGGGHNHGRLCWGSAGGRSIAQRNWHFGHGHCFG
jgi:biotin transport system substrate-specific component